MTEIKRRSLKPSRGLTLFALVIGISLISGLIYFGSIPQARKYVTESLNSAVPMTADIPVPDLLLTDLDGQTSSLRDFQGTVLLINNWATWCPPCIAEMPAMEAYYQAHAHQNFTIIAINSGESYAKASEFADRNSLSFDIFLDPQSQALIAFENTNLPSSYAVDRSGVIRLAWTGAISQLVLEEYLTPLLEE